MAAADKSSEIINRWLPPFIAAAFMACVNVAYVAHMAGQMEARLSADEKKNDEQQMLIMELRRDSLSRAEYTSKTISRDKEFADNAADHQEMKQTQREMNATLDRLTEMVYAQRTKQNGEQ